MIENLSWLLTVPILMTVVLKVPDVFLFLAVNGYYWFALIPNLLDVLAMY